MELNKKQKEAYDFATTGYDKKIFVTAPGGYGKSVLAEQIARFYSNKGKDVICCAFSHKAKNNLKDMFNGDVPENVMIATNAVILGYALNDNDGGKIKLDKKNTMIKVSDGFNADIIIVDEASSIENEHLEDLSSRCSKLISFGDIDQLENISGEKPDFKDFKVIELEENMRQGTTPTTLIKRLNDFKNSVRSGSFNVDLSVDNDGTIVNVDSLVDPYVNGEIDVVICFRNKTIDQYNSAIQNILKGTEYPVIGDTLIMQRPLIRATRDKESGEFISEIIFNNGDSIDIENTWVDDSGFRHVYSKKYGDKILGTRYQLSNLWDVYKENFRSSSKSWSEVKAMFIDARLPHCISVHKSMGSTYDNVGVNIEDIIIANSFDGNLFRRLLNVAYGRARYKVYVPREHRLSEFIVT